MSIKTPVILIEPDELPVDFRLDFFSLDLNSIFLFRFVVSHISFPHQPNNQFTKTSVIICHECRCAWRNKKGGLPVEKTAFLKEKTIRFLAADPPPFLWLAHPFHGPRDITVWQMVAGQKTERNYNDYEQ